MELPTWLIATSDVSAAVIAHQWAVTLLQLGHLRQTLRTINFQLAVSRANCTAIGVLAQVSQLDESLVEQSIKSVVEGTECADITTDCLRVANSRFSRWTGLLLAYLVLRLSV